MTSNNKDQLKNAVSMLKLAGTFLAAGAAYGTLSTRVSSLEQRKDYSVEVVEAKVQITQLSSDVKDMKTDIRTILSRLPK